MLTTWGVALDLEATALDAGDPVATAQAAFAAGRAAYLARCPVLAETLRGEAADLRVTTERIDPLPLPSDGTVRVAVSVTEVRSTSFEFATRIRVVATDHPDDPIDGRCTVVIERRATGERLEVPRAVRDEFVAIQLAAREFA
jgi:acyl-CoA thioesterase FadM